MRPDIHPAYSTAKVQCACGAVWETRSTSGELHLDICSNCHPFFTGKQKLMDTQGRIDRFKKKYSTPPTKSPKVLKAEAAAAAKAEKVAAAAKAAKAAKAAAKPPKKPKAEKPADAKAE